MVEKCNQIGGRTDVFVGMRFAILYDGKSVIIFRYLSEFGPFSMGPVLYRAVG